MAGRVELSHIAQLQGVPCNIRNFCILAHVDHGKTTLSDSLVSSNGIISAKLAGKLRYLDSSEEEQKRGITMHSSAISLLFRNDGSPSGSAPAGNTNDKEAEDYLINLIDSPGHIDFSSDVSTATRLCDGALIVIDAVEGVCTQTHAVIYKALRERLKPCLVLNKIDRLCIELQLTPIEAYHHLKRVVEHVNGLAFTLVNSEIMRRQVLQEEAQALPQSAALNSDTNSSLCAQNTHTPQPISQSPMPGPKKEDAPLRDEEEEEEEDPLFADWNFEPEKGNVVFSSAYDCWAFGLAKFANIWSKRIGGGVNRNILRKYLFEDYYFNEETKKIIKCRESASSGDTKSSTPLFASMVLRPLWQLYKIALVKKDPAKAADIASTEFGIELPPREINVKDPRSTLRSILRRWLPLSEAVLRMIVRTVPAPPTAQRNRLFTLFPGLLEGEASSSSGKEPTAIEAVAEDVEEEEEEDEVQEAAAGATAGRSPNVSHIDMRRRIQHCYEHVKHAVSACAQSHGGDIPTGTRTAGSGDASEACRNSKSTMDASADEEPPVVVFVSKLLPVRTQDLSQRDRRLLQLQRKELRQSKRVSDYAAEANHGEAAAGSNHEQMLEERKEEEEEEEESNEEFVALARVFSGTLKRNSRLYVLDAKHDPYAVLEQFEQRQHQNQHQQAVEDEIPSINKNTTDKGMRGLSNETSLSAVAAGNVRVIPHVGASFTSSRSSTKDVDLSDSNSNHAREGEREKKEEEEGDRMGLYIMLGPSLQEVEEVPAGNVVGIVGISAHMHRTATATLCSTWATHPMTAISFQSKPLLKVALEVSAHHELRSLAYALEMLQRLDPVAEVGVDADSGQHTVSCLGELHLEQCVKLAERFAGCAIRISQPLISFRETVLPAPDDGTTLITTTTTTHSSTSNRSGGKEQDEPPAGSSSSNTSASIVRIRAFPDDDDDDDGSGARGMALTTLPPPWSETAGLKFASSAGRYRVVCSNGAVSFTLRCLPLPKRLIEVLEQQSSHIGRINRQIQVAANAGAESAVHHMDTVENHFWTAVANALPKCAELVEDRASKPQQQQQQQQWDAEEDQEEIVDAALCMSDIHALHRHTVCIGPYQHPTNVLLLGQDTRINICASTSLKPNADVFDEGARIATKWAGGAGIAEIATENQQGENVGTRSTPVSCSIGQTTQSNNGHNAGGIYDQQRIFQKLWSRVHSACAAGFASAVERGPLMGEPMYGVGFVIENIEFTLGVCAAILTETEIDNLRSSSSSSFQDSASSQQQKQQQTARAGATATSILTGQLISELKDAMHVSMLSLPLRVVEPIYRCDLQCDQTQLGNLYAVLSQRRGEVVEEDIIEGTPLFIMTANLPVQASFGFAQQLLKKTSGQGTAPQMRLSHWSTMEHNPFWRPTTADELEEFGDLRGASSASHYQQQQHPQSSGSGSGSGGGSGGGGSSGFSSSSSSSSMGAGVASGFGEWSSGHAASGSGSGSGGGGGGGDAPSTASGGGSVLENLPRSIIDSVRRRKGMVVEEKVVAFAEKQRTLNKKK